MRIILNIDDADKQDVLKAHGVATKELFKDFLLYNIKQTTRNYRRKEKEQALSIPEIVAS